MDSKIREFQEDVLKEFNDLKWIRSNQSVNSAPDFSLRNDELEKSIGKGLISRLLIGFARKSLRSFSERPENVRLTSRAKEILQLPKVKNILCPELSAIAMSDLLEEERDIRIIKVLTVFLMKENLPHEFRIAKDSRLFANMTLQIVEMGIPNYCKG